MRSTTRIILLLPLGLVLLFCQLSAADSDLSVADTALERERREPVPAPAPGQQASVAGGKGDKKKSDGKVKGAKKSKSQKKNGKNKVKKNGGKAKKAGNRKSGKKQAKKSGKRKVANGKNNKEKKGKKNVNKARKGGNKKQAGGKKKGKSSKSKGKKKGKSGRKSPGKGKKKGKSGRKSPGKGKKKGKSGRKSSGKGKKKAGNKRKGQGRSGKRPGGSRQAAGTQNDICVTNMALIMAAFGNNVRVAERLTNRIAIATRLTGNRGGRSEDFNETANTLRNALGLVGNVTEPICGSIRLNNSSPEIGTLNTLDNCLASVGSTCVSETIPEFVATCAELVGTFRNATAAIIRPGQTATEICAAVAAFPINLVEEMRTCVANASVLERTVVGIRNNCSAAFGACRSSQRSALLPSYNCKPGPGGVANQEDATAQLAAASSLRDSAAKAEGAVTDALALSGLAAGTGDDGQLPAGGRSMRHRRQDATESAACTKIRDGLKASSEAVNTAVPTPASPLDMDAAKNATTELDAISSSTSLVDDLGTCTKETAARNIIIIAIIEIRVFIFRIKNWRITIIEIKITLIIVSFPQIPRPTTIPITTAAPVTSVSTNAPSGLRRERIFALMNNQMKLN